MSSVFLECDVDNLSTDTALSPIVPGLAAFFLSLKVSISGTTCEEIGDPSCSYGRVYAMLGKSLPKEKIAMNGAMSFELVPNADYRLPPTPETIHAGSSKKILHKPLAGICTQTKYFLPLWAISSSGQGLSFEFQIILDASAPPNVGGSTSWQLSNVRIYGNVLHCDESLQNTYDRHLLSRLFFDHSDVFVYIAFSRSHREGRMQL